MAVKITGAQVFSKNGTHVATIEAIQVGGGTAGRMNPQGQIEQVTDPLTEHFHVRLLSQTGPMFPDELLMVDTYEDACKAGEGYAKKVDENAKLLAQARDALA